MPKYRQLHTKIVDSFDFNEMPDDFCRVTWTLLLIILDSEGRGIDNPTWIRSKMYPLRPDVTDEQVGAAMDWLAERRMVVRYVVGGRKYFHIPTWKEYQSGTEKEAESRIPAPPDPEPAPINSEPGLELLPTHSGATLELLPTNSASITTAIATADSDSPAAADAAPAARKTAAAAGRNTPKAQTSPPRPNIFAVYEREIGMLTPAIGDELREIEREYPPGWFELAIGEAARNNARKLSYVRAILQRWKAEGLNPLERNPPSGGKPEKPIPRGAASAQPSVQSQYTLEQVNAMRADAGKPPITLEEYRCL